MVSQEAYQEKVEENQCLNMTIKQNNLDYIQNK